MFRRIRTRKTVLLSLLATVLCIALSAFTFGTLATAKTMNIVSATVHSGVNAYRRRQTSTPIRHQTPITTPTTGFTPTPTSGITLTPTSGVTSTATATQPPGATGVTVFVEPTAGEQVFLNAINNAHTSVWLEMYLLTDTNIIQALENAAGHLTVRVMLEPHPYGGGSPASTEAALKAAGAQVEDTSPSFALTHEKGLIIDGTTAYITTSNFTYSALNGKNREYGIIDTNAQGVQGTIAIFNTDWNRTSVQVTDPNLVVSPINARTDFLSFINGAQKTLIIEAEEMQDSQVEQAIVSAAQRGVNVQVILPTPSSSDPNAAGITTIKAAGAQVKKDAQLYMHAKMMVADGTQAFVGSENISTYSLDKNRELGLLLTDTTVIGTLQQTFQQDWNVSQSAIDWGWDF
jgi:phosphatidylserine/phosphatidylglycerophosphate/cardiolipin synthase-like enzyme